MQHSSLNRRIATPNVTHHMANTFLQNHPGMYQVVAPIRLSLYVGRGDLIVDHELSLTLHKNARDPAEVARRITKQLREHALCYEDFSSMRRDSALIHHHQPFNH